MKVRIVYKGYYNNYRIQYRKWFIWWNFSYDIGGWCETISEPYAFATLEEAREKLKEIANECAAELVKKSRKDAIVESWEI